MNDRYDYLPELYRKTIRRKELEKNIKKLDREIKHNRELINYYIGQTIKYGENVSRTEQGIGMKSRMSDAKRRKAYEYERSLEKLKKEKSLMEERLAELKSEWQKLENCDQEFRQLISEKLAEMRQNDHADMEAIAQCERQYAVLEGYDHKLCEAYKAGYAIEDRRTDVEWDLNTLYIRGLYDSVTLKKENDNSIVRKNDEIGDLDRMITELKNMIKEVKQIRNNDVNFTGFRSIENDFNKFSLHQLKAVSGISRLKKELKDVEEWLNNINDYLRAMIIEVEEKMEETANKRDEIIINADITV